MDVVWLAGWYATRLHAVKKENFQDGRRSVTSMCKAVVYAAPQSEWAQKRVDAGIPKCKKCEKIIGGAA